MNLIKFCVLFCGYAHVSLFVLCSHMQMSLFKSSVVKGGNSKGKEPMIDVDDHSPRSKRTRFSTGLYDPDLFRSYAAFQTNMNYFRDAPLLVERAVDQPSLLDTNIPIWFATKD